MTTISQDCFQGCPLLSCRDIAHLALSKITDHGSITSSTEQIRICKAVKLHNYRHNTLKIGSVPAQAASVWHPSTALPRVAVLTGAVALSQVADEMSWGIITTSHREHSNGLLLCAYPRTMDLSRGQDKKGEFGAPQISGNCCRL